MTLGLLRTLYHSLIQSQLQMRLLCWGGACKTEMQVKRKNKFTRTIMKVNHRKLSFSQYKTLNILFQYSTLSTFKTRRLFYTREAETELELVSMSMMAKTVMRNAYLSNLKLKKVLQTIEQQLRTTLI